MRQLDYSLAIFLTLAAVGCQPADDTAPNTTEPATSATADDAASPASPAVAEAEPAGQPAVDESVEADAATLPVTTDLEPVELELGTDELTAGIPGEGPLTLEQIREWLDNPENHRVIQPVLPLGLSAAAANIQGIDQTPMTRAKIELGRQLYFDTRLSSDGSISCASCHHPDEGFTRKTRFGVGVRAQEGNRNSPVSYNRIVSSLQFWDGRASSLEDQAGGPIANAIEMANTHEQCMETLRQIEGYQLQFAKIFPAREMDISTVTQALSTFERAIVSLPAPYDYYEVVRTVENSFGDEIEELKEEDPELYAQYQQALEGSKNLSESAKRGRELFFSDRAACTACHAGANFTDEKFHNIGVGMDVENPDLGRYVVTNVEADKGAFKTPTIRNVALSAPYMHDGSQATLEEVVDWYVKGGHPNPYLSDKIKKLDLNEQEEEDLVAFMKEALTSPFPHIETGRLPE
jgi:cytochrome c peroxidase